MVAWVLVSSEAQVQPQITLEPDYLPDYISVSYDYDVTHNIETEIYLILISKTLKVKEFIDQL